MTVAAPGDEPHTAVVPGKTFQRASKAPSEVLMSSTEQTPARNSGHCRTIVTKIAGPMLRATRQPIRPCART